MRAANKLDEIKRIIYSLNEELSTTVTGTVFLKNWANARELANKHEEAKRKKREKIQKAKQSKQKEQISDTIKAKRS